MSHVVHSYSQNFSWRFPEASFFFVAWTDRKPFKDVRDIMLHPQIGSEGTEFRSDFFHSSLRYIFDSLWKSKDKEIVYHVSHIHTARIFLEGFLQLHLWLHERIENLWKMSEILCCTLKWVLKGQNSGQTFFINQQSTYLTSL